MTFDQAHSRLARAKEVSLIGLIKELGYKLEETGGYYRMISPFRSEGNASFDIDKRKPTKWRDRGSNLHGDVVDFVGELFHLSRKESIDYLLAKTNTIALPEYAPVKRDKKSIEIVSLQPLSSPILRKYLISREISVEVALRHLQEAVIRFPYSTINPNHEHRVLAFRNDSGGYEFRSYKFKLGNSPKNVTTIKGCGDNILLFEGFPDYLTYLTINNYRKEVDTAIILNSVSFLEIMIPFLKGHRILYWGQNDLAGDKAKKRLEEEGIVVKDYRLNFSDHKDLNAFWVAKCKPKKKGFLSEILQF
jgi:hypothetical protein